VASCRLQLTQLSAADDVLLKDQIDVEDFLWRYIEKYHRQDLDKMCASGVKYAYHRDVSPPRLVLDSTDGSTVRDASERIACLCQKLAAGVAETTFPYPDGAERLAFRQLAGGLADAAKAVVYVDRRQVCHVVAPKDRVASLAREIQDAWRNDQYAIVGQPTPPKTASFRTVTPGGVSVEVSNG